MKCYLKIAVASVLSGVVFYPLIGWWCIGAGILGGLGVFAWMVKRVFDNEIKEHYLGWLGRIDRVCDKTITCDRYELGGNGLCQKRSLCNDFKKYEY